jgi:hypothetical protein
MDKNRLIELNNQIKAINDELKQASKEDSQYLSDFYIPILRLDDAYNFLRDYLHE